MRKLIRNLMNTLGYDIIKVNVHSDKKAHLISKVKVGNFIIDMPGNNPHISNYKYEPQVNSQLGRLSLCISHKYPDLIVIDIGANVGDTIAVIKTAIDIPVIGIEGDPISYRFMEKNVAQFTDVFLIKEFLGEKKETVKVELEKTGWNTTLVPVKGSNSGQAISLKTLDAVLMEKGLESRNLKLLKIDTEGFDTIILRGATDLINNHHPVLYFEFNKSNMNAINEDGLSTLFSLEKFGYRTIIFFDNKGRYLLSASISDVGLITQLHHYADEKNSEIAYYDVCLFHETDKDIASEFIKREIDY